MQGDYTSSIEMSARYTTADLRRGKNIGGYTDGLNYLVKSLPPLNGKKEEVIA